MPNTLTSQQPLVEGVVVVKVEKATKDPHPTNLQHHTKIIILPTPMPSTHTLSCWLTRAP